VDIEQSNEPRMSGRGDGGALVRVERRRNWSDEEKLAILKETTVPWRHIGRGPAAWVVAPSLA
jgi:transposase